MSQFDDEYALFQLEIGNLEDNNSDSKKQPKSTAPGTTLEATPSQSIELSQIQNEPIEPPDIENELNYLKGHKCQAPYFNKHEENDETINASYHNALVISVHTPESGVSDINEIYVKVVFTHPIYKAMLTCPYYLDGDCKYSEEKCHFSHGYLVKFMELKEYQNISYDNLQIGQLVLGKNLQNNIWYRAKIVNFNLKEDKVIIQFETGEGKKGHGKNNIEMDLEHIYPLDSDGSSSLESIEVRDTSEEETDINDDIDGEQQFEAIEISLNNKPLDTRLGYWEQHTKGMGSKLMMKMGYIVGTGLGKNCKGRIEPVETFILPQGKSLDYCMNLKEKHGGSDDMFKMEKINRKMESKIKKQNKKNYNASIQKEKTDVFSFLNRNLNQSKNINSGCSVTPSSSNLNIETFKITEKIKKYEKQLCELNRSLNRHERGSEVYQKVYREICAVNNEIRDLNSQETKIHAQIKKHSNKKQMMKF